MSSYATTHDADVVYIDFDASRELPCAPSNGMRLSSIRFKTCPGRELVIRIMGNAKCTFLSRHGLPSDVWVAIETPEMPIRVTRLFNNPTSLLQMLRRYAFLDLEGCLHHKDAKAEFVPIHLPIDDRCMSFVPPELKDATGIPQFFPRSGICWFASICWCFFSSPTLRNWLKTFMPPKMQTLVDRCNYDRSAALELRELWWNEYRAGDDITLPPENDGRNGFSEWSTVCAKLKIPMLRYEPGAQKRQLIPIKPFGKDRDTPPKVWKLTEPAYKTTPHILVIRYTDGDHHKKHAIQRRIEVNGVQYTFKCVMSGQRKCGHQVGWSAHQGNWKILTVGDADRAKDGIGPEIALFIGPMWKDRWWGGCANVFSITKFGPGYTEKCDLNPHNFANKNRDNKKHDDSSAGHSSKPGSNSLDVIYVTSDLLRQ